VINFRSGLNELKENLRTGLCSTLACLAIRDPNPKLLKEILEVHGKNAIRWDFHAKFDGLKHQAADVDADADVLETVRVIENSEFESMVPEGKRFSDLHPLDFLK
jgi:hypothetical protein